MKLKKMMSEYQQPYKRNYSFNFGKNSFKKYNFAMYSYSLARYRLLNKFELVGHFKWSIHVKIGLK